jgi:uncharacterized membrane protein YbhN (UPF0104 family)
MTDLKPRQRLSSGIRWAGTVLALALLVYLLAIQDWGEFWLALQQIPLSTAVGVVILMLLSRIMVCGRWYVLLHSAGVKLTAWECTRLVFAGLFSNNFLPSTIGGDAVRLAGAVQLRWDSATVAASLVVDRLVGMAGMVTLLPLGLTRIIGVLKVTGLPPIPAQHASMDTNTPGLALAAALPGWAKPVWNWTVKFLQGLLRSLVYWLRQPRALLLALLWTYGHQVCLFTTIWLLLQGMGQPVSWWTVASLWVFSYFVSLLPVAVNGLGVQELSIAYLYTQFGGASREAGLALALLIRFLYLLASLPGAFFLPGLLRRPPVTNRPS